MIITENISLGTKIFKRTYSDKGFIIQKVGTDERYSEAIDVLDSEYEYVETDEKMEISEEEYQQIKSEYRINKE